ncbi:M20/M25/M40 family metallo-hydrolase [Candidatus Bipolaricaulota bacterium]
MNERLVSMFCEMVKIDSESGNEERFIDHVRNLVKQELAAECVIDAHGNLIARIPARDSDGAEPIFLGAHADTVKPGIGIEAVVEDGVIRSKGDTILGADDKAGLAAIIEAVRTAKRRPVVDIVVTRGEEIGLVGAKNLDLSLLTAKRGFIVDSDDPATIILGGPTHASLDIEIVGKAAHAAMPEDGISAIRVAAHAITKFEEGKLDPETVANVGTIEGGMIRNGVPERVTLKAECRSLNDAKCRVQAEKMKSAFETTASEAGATANVDLRFEYEATMVEENTPIVELGRKAIEKAGLQSGTRVILGGTDALVLGGRGLDAVVLGYGGKAAHSTDEYIAIEEFEKVTEILRNIVELAADGG